MNNTSQRNTSQPRILVIIPFHFTRYTGGMEMQAWILCKEMVRRGWDVHYASEMNSVPQPVMDGVTLHALPENPSYWKGNRAPLREVMHRLQPDVVFGAQFTPYLGYMVMDAPPNAYTVWWVASKYDVAKWPFLTFGWKNQPGLPFFRRAPVHLWQNHIARIGRKHVQLVLSQHCDQQAALEKLGIHSDIFRNTHTIAPASDIQRHEGRPLILWADSIKYIKRPEVYIELARRCRDLDAEFLLIGRAYADEYAKKVEAAVRELSNFRYGGLIPVSEVNQYYSRAHIHVKTSLPIEGFPNTFIQAWMHGVPVVAYENDPGGFLREQKLGYCAGSVDELIRVVRELITNPDKRREIGARARTVAEQEFDLVRNVDKLEKLLAERGVRLPQR